MCELATLKRMNVGKVKNRRENLILITRTENNVLDKSTVIRNRLRKEEFKDIKLKHVESR